MAVPLVGRLTPLFCRGGRLKPGQQFDLGGAAAGGGSVAFGFAFLMAGFIAGGFGVAGFGIVHGVGLGVGSGWGAYAPIGGWGQGLLVGGTHLARVQGL